MAIAVGWCLILQGSFEEPMKYLSELSNRGSVYGRAMLGHRRIAYVVEMFEVALVCIMEGLSDKILGCSTY